MTLLTYQMTEQASRAATSAVNAGIFVIVIAIIISLAIFSLYVAVGTYVVKKVWFSNWGGNPRRYR